MSKLDIFDVSKLNYEERVRSLKNESSGVVKSTKHFPVFRIDGKEMIFKPLSKTKPFTTPLFSYSEVFWSYLFNKYIDKNTPRYKLALVKDITLNQPKYLENGSIIKNILNDGEELVNLLEFFRKYPDNGVDIDNYVNYCEVQYDYEPILKSKFFRENKDLGEKLAEQILCSILRRDQNYHYENVAFIFKDNKPVRVADIIDLEFSSMFMYPDQKEKHEEMFRRYDKGMKVAFFYDDDKSYEENYQRFINDLNNSCCENTSLFFSDPYKSHLILKNIKTITEMYPEMSFKFINKINLMKEEIMDMDVVYDQDNFIYPFSSDDFRPTRMLFKENKTKDDIEYKIALDIAINSRKELDKDKFSNTLKEEVIFGIDKLVSTIDMCLKINNKEYFDLEEYSSSKFNDTLYNEEEMPMVLPNEMLKILLKKSEEYKNNK